MNLLTNSISITSNKFGSLLHPFILPPANDNNDLHTNMAPPLPTNTYQPWKNVHFALANTTTGLNEHLLLLQLNNANNFHMHATTTPDPISRMTHHSLLFLHTADDNHPTSMALHMIMATTPIMASTTEITMPVSLNMTLIMKATNMAIITPIMHTRMKANNPTTDALPIWAPTLSLKRQVYMLLAL